MTATRRSLRADLAAIGLETGDAVLVHAALRKVGKVVGGPDAIIDALRDVIGPEGTLLAYTDWQLEEEALENPALRDDIPAFDPVRSRGYRENGTWPELVRTVPGALRSGGPGASMTALGGRAAWFTTDHPLDYGYGPGSPLAKLVEAEGKVLMLGCPLDRMTLLHYAEHMADFPNKKVIRYETPILVDGDTVWRWFEEYDTTNPPGDLPEDYMASVVEDFLATGKGRRGKIGEAPSVLVKAAEMAAFGIGWLETKLR